MTEPSGGMVGFHSRLPGDQGPIARTFFSCECTQRGLTSLDWIDTSVDAPGDLEEGADVVVVTNVETEHHSTSLGQFTQHSRRIPNMPGHLAVGVDAGSRSQFVRQDTEVVSWHVETVAEILPVTR